MTLERKRELWRSATARYRKRHRDRHLKQHREQRASFMAQLSDEARREIRRKTSALHRKRHGHELLFRITASLRSRLVIAIRGNPKASTTLKLLGCTPQFFYSYIEDHFQPGMTWDNYGQRLGCWHIDHIIPCAEFDLSDPAQQRQCFHYTNLRPLWALQNFQKGAKRPLVHQGELLSLTS